MKEIGGYFGLELQKGNEYHQNAIRLNTGRNAFEYILKAKRYKKVYLPYYTCDVMLEPINKLKLNYEFYSIDSTFSPLFDFSLVKENEVFVYTNYFGICDGLVREISSKCKNLIIDNSHAFYADPLPGIDTFYSARKYFGVPDGAYLFTDKKLEENFEQDFSFHRCEHLLGRMDVDAENFYATFKRNDEALKNQPIKIMSKLTQRILQSIDYEEVKKIRRDNFEVLNNSLNDMNLLNFELEKNAVPMVYPLLIENGVEFKKTLIDNKIYVATYWPNSTEWFVVNSYEHYLINNLLPLPIDQRYDKSDMNEIIEMICQTK